MSDPAPALKDSATQPPQRIRAQHLVIALLAILTLIGVAKRNAIVRLYQKSQAYVWQRKCMSYTLPGDQPVYAEDPTDMQRLRSDPRYVVDRGAARLIAAPFVQMQAWRYGGKVRPTDATLFLHARSTPATGTRLVVIEAMPFGAQGPAGPRSITFRWEVITPGTVTRFCDSSGAAAAFSLPLTAQDRITLFAGQPDPHDSSKFTLRYLLNGCWGAIDGTLQSSGDIDLVPREGTLHRTDVGYEGGRWELPR